MKVIFQTQEGEGNLINTIAKAKICLDLEE